MHAGAIPAKPPLATARKSTPASEEVTSKKESGSRSSGGAGSSADEAELRDHADGRPRLIEAVKRLGAIRPVAAPEA
eukprot:215311-Pyramimonas_sp.AAC.1